jgi:putative transposase
LGLFVGLASPTYGVFLAINVIDWAVKPNKTQNQKMHYRRAIVQNASYFFTVNLAERQRTLLVDRVDQLRSAFRIVKSQHPFAIEAIVILPDHLHVLMTLPEGDANYSQRWNLIKGHFSRAVEVSEKISASRKKKRERGIWQRRYWEHLIRNEDDYTRHVDYIHYNPVKHGYVRSPVDWQYSSIHRYIAQGILSSGWAAEIDDIEAKFGE